MVGWKTFGGKTFGEFVLIYHIHWNLHSRTSCSAASGYFTHKLLVYRNVYCITGIVRGRKVSRIAFFAAVREKTFAIQAILYTKIPAEIKSARKHSRMLPDSRNSRNFSSADDSRYTVVYSNVRICSLLKIMKV